MGYTAKRFFEDFANKGNFIAGAEPAEEFSTKKEATEFLMHRIMLNFEHAQDMGTDMETGKVAKMDCVVKLHAGAKTVDIGYTLNENEPRISERWELNFQLVNR